ncbi:MAG: leucine zipper domain-containing protein [bacterium]|nr:leucine zipper domain-containing protein [bacterium]
MAQIRQHANARLTVRQRREMVSAMLDEGWPVAAAAERFQVSAKTARKWRGRYLAEGDGGLADRSSRPHASPARTPEATRRRVTELRAQRRRGAAWIASRVGLAPSTVQNILNEAGLGRLDRGDRATAKAQRYVRERPGGLIHVDVKKLPGIPPGGGWRHHGRGNTPAPGAKVGYRYLHSAIDDRSRLVYSEIHDDERGQTAADFWRRAERWFAAWGVRCERVLTDTHTGWVPVGLGRA